MFGPLVRRETAALAAKRRVYLLRAAAAALALGFFWQRTEELRRIMGRPAPEATSPLHFGVTEAEAERAKADARRLFAAGDRDGARRSAELAEMARTAAENERSNLARSYWQAVAERRRESRSALVGAADNMARWWTNWGLVATLVLVPMSLAGSVAGAKSSRTLESLLATPASSRDILAAAIAGRLPLALAALAAPLPVLACGTYIGAFEGPGFAVAAAMIGALGLSVAALTVLASVHADRTLPALFETYSRLAVAAGVVLAPQWATGVFPGWLGAAMATVDPVAALPAAFEDGFAVPLTFAAFHLAAAAGFFAAACRALHPAAFEAARPTLLWRATTGAFRAITGGLRRMLERRRRASGWGTLWRWEAGSAERVDTELSALADRSPLAYRLRCSNAYDPQHVVALLQWLPFAAVCLGVGVVARWWPKLSTLTVEFTLIGAASAWTWLLPLCALGLAAGAWARERQSGQWELLRLADLPAREHVRTAWFGVFRELRPGLAFVALLAAQRVWNYGLSGSGAAGALYIPCPFVFVAQLAMLVAGGLLISAASQTVGQALLRGAIAWGAALAAASVAAGAGRWSVALAVGLLPFAGPIWRRAPWAVPPFAYATAALLLPLASVAPAPHAGRSYWTVVRGLGGDHYFGTLDLQAFPLPFLREFAPTDGLAAGAAVAATVLALVLLQRNFDRFAAQAAETAEPPAHG